MRAPPLPCRLLIDTHFKVKAALRLAKRFFPLKKHIKSLSFTLRTKKGSLRNSSSERIFAFFPPRKSCRTAISFFVRDQSTTDNDWCVLKTIALFCHSAQRHCVWKSAKRSHFRRRPALGLFMPIFVLYASVTGRAKARWLQKKKKRAFCTQLLNNWRIAQQHAILVGLFSILLCCRNGMIIEKIERAFFQKSVLWLSKRHSIYHLLCQHLGLVCTIERT